MAGRKRTKRKHPLRRSDWLRLIADMNIEYALFGLRQAFLEDLHQLHRHLRGNRKRDGRAADHEIEHGRLG